MSNFIGSLLRSVFHRPAPPVTLREVNTRTLADLRQKVGPAKPIIVPDVGPLPNLDDFTDDEIIEIESTMEAHARRVRVEAAIVFTEDPYRSLAEALRAVGEPEEGVEIVSALTRQVGGDHYSKTKMQPFYFTLTNGWDGAAHTILKYVARHEDKGGAEDLEKAIHVVDIRRDLLPDEFERAMPIAWGHHSINMLTYCRVNDYGGTKMDALMALERWVLNPKSGNMHEHVKSAIAIHRDCSYPS